MHLDLLAYKCSHVAESQHSDVQSQCAGLRIHYSRPQVTLHGLRRHLRFELFSSNSGTRIQHHNLLVTMPPRLPPLSSVRFLRRTYATASASSTAPHFRVFDRAAKEAHRTRAALSPHSRAVDYLRDTLASRLVERLLVLLPPASCPSLC